MPPRSRAPIAQSGTSRAIFSIRVGRAAFKRKTVNRLDQVQRSPVRLFGFALFLSCYGLADVDRAALCAFANRAGTAPPKFSGVGPIALIEIQPRQIVQAFERIGMLLAQHPLADLERPLKERLGLRVAPLRLIQARQIVHACERPGMLLAQHPLADLLARA